MMKKNIFYGFVLSLAFVLVSCASSKVSVPPAEVTRTQSRLFWRIDGTDADGNPAVVYLQGTVHVGDQRIYPLSEEVLEAWHDSDRLVGEVSAEDMQALQLEVQKEMAISYKRADGRNLFDFLSEEEKELVVQEAGAEVANSLALFEPWVTNSIVSAVPFQNNGLDASFGLDIILHQVAVEQGRTVLGLDTLRDQLDVLEFGDYDEQLYMLKTTLRNLKEPESSARLLTELYNAYVDDDEVALLAVLNEEDELEADGSYRELMDAYNNKVYAERNQKWAEKIKSWIAEGGTTFVFAGSGHFVGKDSLFYYLKKNKTIKK